MRSALLFLAVRGAVGEASPACSAVACEIDVDANSLLQGRSSVRRHKFKDTNADELLTSVRKVAASLEKHSTETLTPEEVNAAIGQASTALSTMFPLIAQQHTLAEQQLAHALGAIEACHSQHGGTNRVDREQRVVDSLATAEACVESLGEAVEEEERVCEGQGEHANCECTDARTAVVDRTAQCQAERHRYEALFCESILVCEMLHDCHAQEVEVYNAVVADVEAEMVNRQQQYITLRQTNCIMDLITAAMLSGTPIDHSLLVACDDVSVDELQLTFPDAPDDPRVCHVRQPDEPHCGTDQPVTCSVEIEGSTQQHAGSGSGGNVQFFDGDWRSSMESGNVSPGQVVTLEQELQAPPSALRITAGGDDAWGYKRISVTCGGETWVVLDSENGEAYDGNNGDVRFWVDGNQAAPAVQEYHIGQATCAVEVETSSQQHANTGSGGSVQFSVNGGWSTPRLFAQSIQHGQVVRAADNLASQPSAIRIVAGGDDAWGYKRISLTCSGNSWVLLDSENGETYDGNQADVRFWVDGNQAAPEVQEYDIPHD